MITSRPPPRTRRTRLRPSVRTSRNSMSGREELKKLEEANSIYIKKNIYHVRDSDQDQAFHKEVIHYVYCWCELNRISDQMIAYVIATNEAQRGSVGCLHTPPCGEDEALQDNCSCHLFLMSRCPLPRHSFRTGNSLTGTT